MPRVPLNQPFQPQFTGPVGSTSYKSDSNITVTRLANGMRVVSSDTFSPLSSIGIYVDAGSRYDTPETTGTTQLMESLIFKSTSNRSALRIVRDSQQLGTNLVVSSTRDSFMVGADCLPVYVPQTMALLADALQNHLFLDEEVEPQLEFAREMLPEQAKNADAVVVDHMHKAAFGDRTLGLPIAPTEYSLSKINSHTLRAWSTRFFQPSRMVVAGLGMDHQQLLDLTQQCFNNLPPASSVPAQHEKAVFVGGDVRTYCQDTRADPTEDEERNLTHFVFGFEGVPWNDPDIPAVHVLSTMMGGGFAFSAGGPGKGMYSRMYQNVMGRSENFYSAHCSSLPYNDTGLLSFYGTTNDPATVRKLVEVLIQEALSMRGSIGGEEFKRAKNALRNSVYFGMESRLTQTEEMGRQLLSSVNSDENKIITPHDWGQRIDAVTVADVHRVVDRLLKGKMMVAAHGIIDDIPSYDQIARCFK